MSEVTGEWPSADEIAVVGGPVVDPDEEEVDEEQVNRRTCADGRETFIAPHGGCGTHVAIPGQTATRSGDDSWYQPPEIWYHRGGVDE